MITTIKTNGGGSLVATLLWTNPSPTADFAEQTISLDLSAYKSIYCVTLNAKEVGNQTPYYNYQVLKNVDECFVLENSFMRHITFNNEQISMGNGYRLNSSWILSNANLVPYKIYGLK